MQINWKSFSFWVTVLAVFTFFVIPAGILAGVAALIVSEESSELEPEKDNISCFVQYAPDPETEKLKREFEIAWLPHVIGYTNFSKAGMADNVRDMELFIREWKPRVLRNHVFRESDVTLRVEITDRMMRANSIDDLYYGLLVPHEEMLARWKAYDDMANSSIQVGNVDLTFNDGRAKFLKRGKDMTAVIRPYDILAQGPGDAHALVLVGGTSDFDNSLKTGDSVEECWLVHFRDGKTVSSKQIPVKDFHMVPSIREAPFGRKYMLRVNEGNIEVVNCVTREIVVPNHD